MTSENETLRWPTNLNHAAISQRLVNARTIAERDGLTEVARLLNWLEGKSELRAFTLQIEMVAHNLKNLK